MNKTLSIFGWKKRKETPHKEALASQQTFKTVGDLKQWVKNELPPLAWQRICLRLTKFVIEHYNFSLNSAPDGTKLPNSLLQKINEVVKEIFNKQLPYGN